MPRACTVCASPHRAAIDAALADGRVSLRTLASRYTLGVNALHRHSQAHIGTPRATCPDTEPAPTDSETTHTPRDTPAVPDDMPAPMRSRRHVQRVYLRALAQTGNKLEAAKAAGISPVTALRWAARDADFAEKVQEAQGLGDQLDLADLEGVLGRRVRDVKDPVSGILLMFRMKRLDPRYRDGSGVTVNAQGPVAITLGLEAEPAPQPVGGGAHAKDITPRRVKELA